MKRSAKFEVVGQLDRAGAAIKGTVIIDRAAGLFTVRPHRKRKTYTLSLGTVATWVCRAVTIAELKARRAEKLHKR